MVETNLVKIIAPTTQFAILIQQDLEKMEQLLLSELTSGEKFLQEVIAHLAKAGGKRFRPLFTILAAYTCPKLNVQAVIQASLIIEIIHLATLYHDDVMDTATMRRGVPAAQVKWGNNLAILAGDYLFARASTLATNLGLEVVKELSHTYGLLVTGQFRETVNKTETDPISHYLKIIQEKTASLISSCGTLAGIVCEASPEHLNQLRQLGGKLGLMFQIADDVIDLQGKPDNEGKQVGTDLRTGVKTLPILYALAEETSIGIELRKLLANPLKTTVEVNRARELLLASNGITRAMEKLDQYFTDCLTIINSFPVTPAKEALINLVTYTKTRLS